MTGGYDEIPFVCLASQEVQGGEKVVRGKYWRKLWLEARSRRAPYSAFPPPPRLRVAQRPPSQNFSTGRQSQGGSGVETARWVSLSQLGGFLFFILVDIEYAFGCTRILRVESKRSLASGLRRSAPLAVSARQNHGGNQILWQIVLNISIYTWRDALNKTSLQMSDIGWIKLLPHSFAYNEQFGPLLEF